MNKKIVKEIHLPAEGEALDISDALHNLLSSSPIANAESRQIIHKLNRILVEIEFGNKNRHKFLSLTEREKQIITLIVLGNSNPQIADQLFISRSTVEQHRKNINRKLELNTLSDLCLFAYAFNLI